MVSPAHDSLCFGQGVAKIECRDAFENDVERIRFILACRTREAMQTFGATKYLQDLQTVAAHAFLDGELAGAGGAGGILVNLSVRTIGISDDSNHDVVEAKSVYMKISSDTRAVGFYYSLDKKAWQLIRLFKNDYPASIWVGISAQSPLGERTSAVFEDISLTKQSISDFRLGN